MKRTFTHRNVTPLLVALFTLFIPFAFVHAQTISGMVRDAETGEKLQAANVIYAKGKGTVTNEAGRYQLVLPEGEYTLKITYIGYKSERKEIAVKQGEDQTVDFVLKSNEQSLGTVVVSGSQYKKNVAKETVSIDVIPKNLIKNISSRDLGEAVGKTSGVIVQDGQITIRSGSSYSYGIGTRTAVLQDGINLTSSDLGEGQLKMSAISNAKQIEVIKGASSVIYGSSALSGVVNVITEWPTEDEPKTEIDVSAGVFDNPPKQLYKPGNFGLPSFAIINANHQRKIGNYQLIAGGNITMGKSYMERNDEFRTQLYLKNRYLSKKTPGLNYGLNTTFQIENSERFFISTDMDSNLLFALTSSGDQYYRTTVDPFVNYSNPRGHNYRLSCRYMNIFREGGDLPDAIGHQIFMDNQYQYRFKDLLVVTAGMPFSTSFNQSNLYENRHRTFMWATYLQTELNYKFVSWVGGLRYEINVLDSIKVLNNPVFRTGLNFKASPSTYIRTSWGQGYRIPSIAEKYIAQNFFETALGGVKIVPNDTLHIETGWNLELGVKQAFKIDNWKGFVDFAFYWQENQNLIEYRLDAWPNQWSDGRPIFDSAEVGNLFGGKVLGLKPLNIETARVAGYELSLGTKGKIGPVGLQIVGGYNYSYPTPIDDSLGTKNVGNYLKLMFTDHFRRLEGAEAGRILQYRQRHLFKVDLELSYWKASLAFSTTYLSSPELIAEQYYTIFNTVDGGKKTLAKYQAAHTQGDWVVDMRAGVQVNEKVRLGFVVKNLANRAYMIRPGKAEALRHFILQFRYTF